MPWSFNAKGTKEQCIEQLDATAPPDDPANAHHFEFMRAVLRHELERYGDGSKEMSVSASGHVPSPPFCDRSLSIWISGQAEPQAERAKSGTPRPETPEPPLTKRSR